jgi:hypothetical protein
MLRWSKRGRPFFAVHLNWHIWIRLSYRPFSELALFLVHVLCQSHHTLSTLGWWRSVSEYTFRRFKNMGFL